jgi:hypothetical protein
LTTSGSTLGGAAAFLILFYGTGEICEGLISEDKLSMGGCVNFELCNTQNIKGEGSEEEEEKGGGEKRKEGREGK